MVQFTNMDNPFNFKVLNSHCLQTNVLLHQKTCKYATSHMQQTQYQHITWNTTDACFSPAVHFHFLKLSFFKRFSAGYCCNIQIKPRYNYSANIAGHIINGNGPECRIPECRTPRMPNRLNPKGQGQGYSYGQCQG